LKSVIKNQSLKGGKEKMEVEFYVEQFSYIASRLNGRGKQAIALAIMQELAKDRRMAEIAEARQNNNGSPPTARQVAYAKALGIELPDNTTKEEATKLITEAIAKKQNGMREMQ
jgi:hypothetical protein